MNNNKLIEFLSQLILRLFSKTPWFFKVIQALFGITALILLVPEWVTAYEQGGFTLPETWSTAIKTIVGYALVAQTFLAQLAVPADVKKENNIKD
jgi:hypothetical protein